MKLRTRKRTGYGGQKHHTVVEVAFTNPDYLPPLINECRLMAGAGWRVRVICRDFLAPTGVRYPCGVNVTRVSTRGGPTWLEYVGFVAHIMAITDRDVAVVVGHDMGGFLAARLLALKLRVPLVYRCHDLHELQDGASLATRLVHFVERSFARTADLVVVPDAGRGSVATTWLRLRQMPMVVANAPPIRVAPGGALRSALCARGVDFDRVLLRQGRIGPGHGIEVTIRSMPFWRGGRWGFVLLGYCDDSYRQYLAGLAESLGVASNLVILPPVPYDEVASYVGDADCGHALYEPSNINHRFATTASNKLMEHMAAGIPSIVSDTPDLRRLVLDRGCGLVADVTALKVIAHAVNQVLEDPEARARMGSAARSVFVNELCYDRQLAPYMERLSGLVRRRGGNSRRETTA